MPAGCRTLALPCPHAECTSGMSLSLRPFIFTPDDVPLVVDVELARKNPALAVLSAICHGGDAAVDAMFPALAAALQSVGPGTAISYYDVVLAGLPQAAQTRWEAFMTTTADQEFISERLRKLVAENQAIGETRGEARGVPRTDPHLHRPRTPGPLGASRRHSDDDHRPPRPVARGVVRQASPCSRTAKPCLARSATRRPSERPDTPAST